MTEAALAAASRIVRDEEEELRGDAQLVASMLITTLAAVAKLGPILESVGLSHSQAMQIIARMYVDA